MYILIFHTSTLNRDYQPLPNKFQKVSKNLPSHGSEATVNFVLKTLVWKWDIWQSHVSPCLEPNRLNEFDPSFEVNNDKTLWKVSTNISKHRLQSPLGIG